MKILIACCLVLGSTPALAQQTAHSPRQVSEALKAGCTVHQPVQIAGKTSYAPAIVHCADKRVADCRVRQMPHLSGKTPHMSKLVRCPSNQPEPAS